MIGSGRKVIAAAGTAEAIAATRMVVWVTVQADPGNTGNVYVGSSSASSTNGVELEAGDSVYFPAVDKQERYDLAEIYADVATNGDAVLFIYLERG